jgi:uncharacterized repeat protein (TIGR01451 family)
LLALCLLGLWGATSQTGGLRRLTNTTEEGININPSLSGDGRRVAFESTEDLAHTGGSDRFRAIRADLADDPAVFTQMTATRAPAPGISQDGSSIAFAAKDDPLGTNADGNSEIFLFDGATLKQITNTTPNDISTRTHDGNFQPSLTDDGRFIAFSSNRNLTNQNGDSNLEVFIFDTATNTFTQFTNTIGAVGASDAKISGDGSRIAYIRDNNASPGAQRDLVLQDRSGGTTRLIAGNVSNLAFTYGRAISDDGSRIVYSADVATDSSQVFLFDGRTSNSTRQITALGVRTTEVPLHPTISGDGSRIAFATRRPIAGISNTDNSIEVYTFDIPTGQFARVTNAPSNADGFDGSSRVAEVVSSLNDDGSVIAFNFPRSLSGAVTTGLENNSEIYVTGTAARPTTGSLTILNEASFGHEPSTTKAIAPDSNAVALGGALAFTTQQAPKDNNTFPTTGGGTTVTVNGRRAQISFISPTQVNFIVPPQTELGTAEVVVTNAEGFQSRGTVAVLRAAPGIFTKSGDGQGEGVVLNANLQGSGTFDPSDGQLRLIIFTTGVRHATQVTATAGGRALTVESFMASPDMPGMDEVHVLVPADLRGAGTVNLVVRADNRDSNPVTITFAGNSCRDIVINEVLADPPDGASGDANHDGVRDSSDDEFVELVNTTANNIDISGYQLLTRSTSAASDTLRHTFAPGTLFPAGSAIVVFGGGGPNFNPTNAVFGGAQVFKASSGALSLTNSGGVVTLRQPSQSIVNIFSYGGSTGLNGDANQSLTRSPDAGTSADCGSFTLHSTAPGSNGQPFSPGTRVNGSPFTTGIGRLSSITISPPSASVTRGQTTQFTAQARDQFNRPMTGVTITFTSDNTGVATVDSVSTDPNTGVATATLTGRSAGTANITAQATDGTTTVMSSQSTLTVNEPPPVVTRVEVSPSNPTINRGQTQQFTATAFDQNNQPISGASFTWSSSNTNVATINANGLASGVGVGSVTITATTSDATGTITSGTATLNVQVPLVINEINADVGADNTSTTTIEGDSNRDGVRDSDDDEFIELLNNSNAPVDISGIVIADATSNRYTIPANTTLAAGRALVIFGGGTINASDPAFGGALVLAVSGSGTLSLNDTGDTVNVKLSVGGSDVIIATQSYGGTSGVSAPSDQSLTRSPDAEVGTTGGSFVQHTSATNAAGRTFSPGTRADGTPFGSTAITRIEVSPATSTKDINGTQIYTAHAFSNVGGIEFEVLNVSFIWDSSDTSKATVAQTTGQSTTVTAVSPGSSTIRARAGGQQGSATFTINSTPPVLTSVTIQPASATIGVGDTQQFTAQAKDQFGQDIGGVTISFASSNTTVATVDAVSATSSTGSATATVTGRANGSAEIRATADNGNTTVTSSPAALTVAPVVSAGSVLVSEFRTRGPNGASDEFVEIYNPTTSAVLIGGMKIRASNGSGTISDRVTITAGTMLGSGCHYLIANSTASTGYSGSTTPDQTYSTGITDDGGIAITRSDGTTILDQVGMSAGSAYKEGTTLAALSVNTNQSYERKPGGSLGNGTDTNNNANDFFLNATSSNPQNSSSGCLDLSSADLSITKTDSPDPVTTGSDVTYTITVTNNGAGTAQTVIVTDNLPGSMTFVSCSSTGTGVCGGTGNNRTITFSSLASGATATITLVATANSAGGTTITNTATVSSSTTDTNTVNNSATATTTVQAVAPTVSINDVVVTEGDSGTKTVDFTVTLSAASTQTVTVGYATSSASPATATADTDYVSTSGTLTFAPSETTKPITVTIKGDTLVEPNETFFVNLSGATNAIILDGQGQGTITNDDTAALVISQIYGGGGNSGAQYRNDFIEIFNRGTTTVDFSVTPYSAQYASSTSGTWNVVAPLSNGTLAPGKYFLIQAGNAGGTGGVTLTSPDATGTVDMSSTGGKVALVLGTTAINSNTTSPASPLTSSASPGCPTNATIADFVGYGTTATCFEGAGRAPAPSSTTADFRKLGGCQDTNNNNADFDAPAAPSPRNNGTAPNSCAAPALSITDVTVAESAGTSTFTVSLNNTSTGAITVNYSTADSTAVAPGDYNSNSGTLTFAPGVLTQTITVAINDDTLNEATETFFVNLSGASGATIADNQGVGTITDNDTAPSLSINDVSISEGNSGTKTLNFTVTLSAASGQTVTVNYATSSANPATATAGTDYQSTSGTLTFAPGDLTKTISVTINGDTTVEPDETFFVNLSGETNASVSDNQGVGTITNDDIEADLSITKMDSPDPVNAGDNITYTLTVTNNSSTTAAENVTVSDAIPVNTTLFSVGAAPSGWTRTDSTANGSSTGTITFSKTTSLPASGTATFTITVKVDSGADNNSTISNTATVASTTRDDTSGNNSATATTTVRRPADLSLSKTVNNATPNVNENVTFTITVSNAGPFAATNVSVRDVLPSGLTYVSDDSSGTYNTGTGIWTVGTLNASSSATLHITATATSASISGVTNTAQVQTSDQFDPDSTPGNNAAEDDLSSVTVRALSADLSLTKTVDNSAPNLNDTIVFTIKLSNGGQDPAPSVQVTDLLPSGLQYVSSTPSGTGTYDNSSGIWNVGTVAVGANTATLTITATVQSTGTVTNTAEVTQSGVFDPDSTPNNHVGTEDDQKSINVSTGFGSADLSLTKSVDNASPNVGDNVTFTIKLSNAGPNAATSVQVTDQLPTGLSYVSSTVTAGTYDSSTGVWNIGNVATGTDVATLTITAKVLAAGAKTNTASITQADQSDTVSGNNSASATVTPLQADLSITKSDSPDPVTPGGTLTYTITVTNNGPDAAQNITVTDNLPVAVTFTTCTSVSGNGTCGGTGNNRTVTFTSIANGASETITIKATVSNSAADGSTISNTASVSSSTTFDSNTVNNSASATTAVHVPFGDITVTKTGPNTVLAGNDITYTITVTNNGPDDSFSPRLTDDTSAGATFSSISIPSGWGCSHPAAGGTGSVNCSRGAQPNGEASVFTLVMHVTSDFTFGDSIVNVATMTSSNDSNGSNNQGSVVTTVNSQADLSLTKTVDNTTPVFGQNVVFTVKLSNVGPSVSKGVQVTDLLPSGLQYVSSTTTQGSYASGTGIWTVGTVGVGADVATLTITATVASGGPKTNTAEVTASSTFDPDSTPNNRATLPAEDDTASVSFTAFDVAVINEFVVNPTIGKEYVELLVTAPGGADLRGFVLSDVNGRTGTPGASEGDIILGQDNFLSNVPQGTYVVIELTVPTANASTLTEDISTSDGNRKLVLKTTGIASRTNVMDLALNGENIQLYGPGGRATGRVVDQVLIGGTATPPVFVLGPDGTTIQAPWGDNNTTTTTDNIGQSSGLTGNPNVAFCPTADTLAEFQNNDTRTRFTVTASSYGTPGAKNTCVATDESINNH